MISIETISNEAVVRSARSTIEDTYPSYDEAHGARFLRGRGRSETLRPTASGPAVGMIYIAVGDETFPSEDWDDFASVILPWWSEALVALLRPEAKSARWTFMDGPYEVRLVRLPDNRLPTELVKTSRGGPVVVGRAVVSGPPCCVPCAELRRLCCGRPQLSPSRTRASWAER